MVKVKFWQRGREFDFKRVGDRVETVILYNAWRSGGLLYGYIDRFNIVSIGVNDIISINE